jgi:hypothetical protein
MGPELGARRCLHVRQVGIWVGDGHFAMPRRIAARKGADLATVQLERRLFHDFNTPLFPVWFRRYGGTGE